MAPLPQFVALALSTLLGPPQPAYVPAITLHGGEDELFAACVSRAGDVDGDGLGDVLVYGVHGNGALGGIAHVFSGQDGSELFTFPSAGNHGLQGTPLRGAGDVNADGFDDVIVGSGEANFADVYSGADGSPLRHFEGDLPGDGFGGSVSGAGDIDGDGVADVIVGTTGPIVGYARVFSGIDGSVIFTVRGQSPGDSFGVSVDAAGFLDGDGHADVVVGARGDGHPFMNPGLPVFGIPPFRTDDDAGGVAQVHGPTGRRVLTMHGDNALDALGAVVRGAGDVNGDGFDDVIAGSFSTEVPSGPGYARVLSGADGSELYTFIQSLGSGTPFVAVAAAGDSNHDGLADLLVASLNDDAGQPDVQLLSGADGSELFQIASFAHPATRLTVDGIGDLNGDGAGDFVVGVMENFVGGGYAVIYLSRG